MATTNKATASKQITRKQTTPKRQTEEAIAPVEVAPQKRKFKNDDGVLCRSITVGGLYLDGVKSGNFYSWVDYGDEVDVEYCDLVAMIRGKSKFVFAPLVIIDDDDFIEEFPQLKKFYDDQYTVKDLEGILDLKPNDMIATIKTLPKGALNSLKSIASTRISEGRLDSMTKIKALDEFFNTNLALIAEYTKN